jgi:hypothetical protein
VGEGDGDGRFVQKRMKLKTNQLTLRRRVIIGGVLGLWNRRNGRLAGES